MADRHKNFSYSTVLTAPSPASSGTSLVVQAADGVKFPTVPFNATVWPAGAQPLTTNAEIVRVTAISTDTFTIARAQESSVARSIVVGDQIAATVTAKTLEDVDKNNSGWQSLADVILSVSTGYNKGNKEYDITTSSDVSSLVSAGMRLKVSRGTTAPTQCTDLELSSSQYASKTTPSGITFTDDFTCEAWIKVESYGGDMGIISRFDGSNGFIMYVASTGVLRLYGDGAATREFSTIQSLPIGKWIHVAATLDMSTGTGAIYINGASVSIASTGGVGTSLTQAGNLQVGAYNGGNTFDGKISDARIWDVVRTATQIRDNMNQQLAGSETNLVAYFKLNGNFNDSTSNANNLTASGSAAATNTDNPMVDTEYAIVTKVTSTIITVFTGTDYNIPNMTLSNPHYSTHKSPYGFMATPDRWYVSAILKSIAQKVAPTAGTWYNDGSINFPIPLGIWRVYHQESGYGYKGSGAIFTNATTLSTANNTESEPELTSYNHIEAGAGLTFVGNHSHREKPLVLSAQTTYYLNYKTGTASSDTVGIDGSVTPAMIVAECGYL